MKQLPARQETPLLSVAAIRELEEALFEQQDSYVVMHNAAKALFALLTAEHPCDPLADHAVPGVHILLGSGNNAGDGLLLAGLLCQAGYRVAAYTVFEAAFSGEAKQAWDFAHSQGVAVQKFAPFDCQANDIIVEAIFGIGLDRPISGLAKEAIDYTNYCKTKQANVSVYAVDIPAGIVADTGCSVGVALEADKTVTFIGDKIGLHTGDGRACAGEVAVADLHAQKLAQPETNICRYRYQHSNFIGNDNRHKGDFGHLLLVGGGQGMFGAAALACASALKVGTGKVSSHTHADYNGQYYVHDTPIYEVMHCLTLQDVSAYDSVVLGPGLGRGAWGRETFKRCLAVIHQPLLVDADGLWHLAESANPPPIAVITPHEGEAARLLGVSVQAVRSDKVQAVKALARRYSTIAVLKGGGTLLSDGDSVWINQSGNVYLATAGTGDVLAGMIGGYLAQGCPPLDAALYGVYRHGLAADAYRRRHADKTMRASDLWEYF